MHRLFIVDRAEFDLFEIMRRDLLEEPNTTVIQDRRRHERRRQDVSYVPDRRLRERRMLTVDEDIRRFGWAVVELE